jgi:hypothetical protein
MWTLPVLYYRRYGWLFNLLTREEKEHIIRTGTADLGGPLGKLPICLPRMVWSRSLSTSS